MDEQPSPRGRGCHATALSPAVAGRVRGQFRSHCQPSILLVISAESYRRSGGFTPPWALDASEKWQGKPAATSPASVAPTFRSAPTMLTLRSALRASKLAGPKRQPAAAGRTPEPATNCCRECLRGKVRSSRCTRLQFPRTFALARAARFPSLPARFRQLAQSEALRPRHCQMASPKLPKNLYRVGAEAPTLKDPGSGVSAGVWKPRLPWCEMASTGRHDEGSIPHWKPRGRAALCAIGRQGDALGRARRGERRAHGRCGDFRWQISDFKPAGAW